MVVNVFDVDDFFWKKVTDQQLRPDASYGKKIVFSFLHWKKWDKQNPSQFIEYTKIMKRFRSFPVQPPRVGYHQSGVDGHPRNVVGVFEEKKFRIAWNELVENGSILQQEETPNDRLLTRHRLNKSPLASRRHRPYGKFYCHDDVMDDVDTQRSNYKLRQFRTQEQIDALENTGMIWDLDKLHWQRDLILYDRYFEKYADGDPAGYTTVSELLKYVDDGSRSRSKIGRKNIHT